MSTRSQKNIWPFSPWYMLILMATGIVGAILGTIYSPSKMYLIIGTEIALFGLGLLMLKNELSVLVQCLLVMGVATPFLVATLAPSYYPSQAHWFTSKGFWIMLGLGALPGLLIFFLGVYVYTVLERVRKIKISPRSWIKELILAFHICIGLLIATFFQGVWNTYSIVVAYSSLYVLLAGLLFGMLYRFLLPKDVAAKGMILLGVLGILALGFTGAIYKRSLTQWEAWMIFVPSTLAILTGIGLMYLPTKAPNP